MKTVKEIDAEIKKEEDFIQSALNMYGSEIISGTLYAKLEKLQIERDKLHFTLITEG